MSLPVRVEALRSPAVEPIVRVQASEEEWRQADRVFQRGFGLHVDPEAEERNLGRTLRDRYLAVFVDGMDNICATHKRVAESYFADGGVAMACPPLKALLEIMAHGVTADGKDLNSPEVRALFTREHLLASDWYAARLDTKSTSDIELWKRHVQSLELFLDQPHYADVATRLGIKDRLAHARAELTRVSTPERRESLVGTLGLQPL